MRGGQGAEGRRPSRGVQAWLGLTRGVCSSHPKQLLGNGDPPSRVHTGRASAGSICLSSGLGLGRGCRQVPTRGGQDAGVFTWAACGRQGGRV